MVQEEKMSAERFYGLALDRLQSIERELVGMRKALAPVEKLLERHEEEIVDHRQRILDF